MLQNNQTRRRTIIILSYTITYFKKEPDEPLHSLSRNMRRNYV